MHTGPAGGVASRTTVARACSNPVVAGLASHGEDPTLVLAAHGHTDPPRVGVADFERRHEEQVLNLHRARAFDELERRTCHLDETGARDESLASPEAMFVQDPVCGHQVRRLERSRGPRCVEPRGRAAGARPPSLRCEPAHTVAAPALRRPLGPRCPHRATHPTESRPSGAGIRPRAPGRRRRGKHSPRYSRPDPAARGTRWSTRTARASPGDRRQARRRERRRLAVWAP